MLDLTFRPSYSKTFVFPLLDMPYGKSILRTYLSWEGFYNFDDNRLILECDSSNIQSFSRFEQAYLKKSLFYDDVIEVDDSTTCYIFNLIKCSGDLNFIRNGMLSKISENSKTLILNFYSKIDQIEQIEAWLYPEKYHNLYCDMLFDIKDHEQGMSIIKSTYELVPLPNLNNEILRKCISVNDQFSIFNNLNNIHE